MAGALKERFRKDGTGGTPVYIDSVFYGSFWTVQPYLSSFKKSLIIPSVPSDISFLDNGGHVVSGI